MDRPDEDRARPTSCPLCGRPAIDQRTDEEKCRPSNCAAWQITAVYDKAERRWVTVDEQVAAGWTTEDEAILSGGA